MNNRIIILNENQFENFINEKKIDDIDVKTYEIKDSLHPKFWINNKLNSNIRLRLLKIADDFVDGLGIKNLKVDDIVLTGSIANYNWTKYSDIDIHIITDYEKIFHKKDFVKGYFDGKKESWKNEHENLKIFGFPVELYVEDKKAPAVSSGIYSLEDNKWIIEPNENTNAKFNAEYVKKTASDIMDEVDDIEYKLKKEKNDKKINTYIKQLENIFERMKRLRKNGLETKAKEMSSGNIIWKILRADGYITKIWDIINTNYDKVNSINESMTKTEINKELKKVNTHPTDNQKKVGNYRLGHINILGFDISIENPKGSYRYWKSDDGKTGKNLMKNHYGYFNRSMGRDGDQVDVFIGDNLKSERIYVVDQYINGKFDESKVMLGFSTKNEAKKAYLSNFEKGWKGLKYITSVDINEFKEWLYTGRKQQKAFALYKNVKKL